MAAAAIALASWSGLAACGGGDSGREERADAAAKPPTGWRTVANRRAGFTISLPPRWSTRRRGELTTVRSPDRLVVATITADRSASGRETLPAVYARHVVERFPGFEGSFDPDPHRVTGSPYPSARLDAVGRVETSPDDHAITVAAFHRHGRVTYSITVFRNPRLAPGRHDRELRRVLASLRAQPPHS